ncbi:MAG: hypothetical protein ACR2MF_00410 [Chthoniobacterales bacterium]
MLKSETTPVLRAIHLLWRRMGGARFYVLASAGAIFLLAVVGLFHLANTRKPPERERRAEVTSVAQQSSPAAKMREEVKPAMSPPAVDNTVSDHPFVAITEVAPQKRYGPHGETRVDLRIGVTPQANAPKGPVEIRVFFYDVTRNGEMRPTDAQVTYEWVTQVRDWTDPSPKYLVATYLGLREPRRSSEELRYGGFIVRIYVNGELQDAKSEPAGLLAALRSGAQPRVVTGAAPATMPVVAPSPILAETPLPKTEVPAKSITPAPATFAISPEKHTVEDAGALPYARPVPGKPGFVYSPYDEKFLIDVRGAPPGTVVNDPNAGKAFRVP